MWVLMGGGGGGIRILHVGSDGGGGDKDLACGF